MALIYNSEDLTNLAAQFQCCLGALSYKALKAEIYQMPDKDCFKNKMLFLDKIVCILTDYTPSGTLVTPGFISSATLDMTTISGSFPGVYSGRIRVNGMTIGTLPDLIYDSLYTDPNSLISGIVDAIANGGSGYTAVNNGNGTITILSPGSGSAANGFIVDIIINPEFVITDTLDLGATENLRQMITVNDQSSDFYGLTAIATISNGPGIPQYVNYLFNHASIGTTVTRNILLPTPPSYWGGSLALAHRKSQDSITSVSIGLGNAWLINSAFAKIGDLPGVSGATSAIYNETNSCTYFLNALTNTVRKVDATGVVTVIPMTSIHTKGINANMAAVDETSGNLWVVGNAAGVLGLKIVHPTTDVITNIDTGVEVPEAIAYYPGDGTVGSERMFVSFSTATGIRSYNLNGTVDAATFHAFPSRALIYSRVHNVLFASNPTETRVIRASNGTLKQPPFPTIISSYSEDENTGEIVGKEIFRYVHFIALANSGVDNFSGALEEGTPDIYTDGSENCLSEDELTNMIEVAKSICCQIDY